MLYRRYLSVVLRWCLRETGNREVAADLSAKVFAPALTSAHRYRADQGSVLAWLLGIARNKLLESRRRGRVANSAHRSLRLEPVLPTDPEDSFQYPSRAKNERSPEGFVHVPGPYCTRTQTSSDLATRQRRSRALGPCFWAFPRIHVSPRSPLRGVRRPDQGPNDGEDSADAGNVHRRAETGFERARFFPQEVDRGDHAE